MKKPNRAKQAGKKLQRLDTMTPDDIWMEVLERLDGMTLKEFRLWSVRFKNQLGIGARIIFGASIGAICYQVLKDLRQNENRQS